MLSALEALKDPVILGVAFVVAGFQRGVLCPVCHRPHHRLSRHSSLHPSHWAAAAAPTSSLKSSHRAQWGPGAGKVASTFLGSRKPSEAAGETGAPSWRAEWGPASRALQYTGLLQLPKRHRE
uniref:Uncharacterized protein n=1 Tax=Molossus molossus TaxID=27622 RepID=A0A7J8I7U5_MOLMO|nr:hypothetical protein HJG59_010513 [Molossus molossus]